MKSSLPGLIIFLAATPALAQSVALFNESGYVDILCRVGSDPTLIPVEADDILDSYILEQIIIGRGGPLAQHETGELDVEGAGATDAFRRMADVEVRNGELNLGGSLVEGSFRLGASGGDPTSTYMSIELTTIQGSVTASDGSTFGCLASEVDALTVTDGGYAQIIGCLVHEITSTELALLVIEQTSIEASAPEFRGNVSVGSSAITSTSGTVADGLVRVGAESGGVEWTASSEIRVGEGSLRTDFVVENSTIESASAYIGGEGSTGLFLQDAATWRATDHIDVQGSQVTALVEGASRLESNGDLWIGEARVTVRSAAEAESRIDVDGDLEIGRTGASGVGDGTLTIQDGGVVSVDGTLTIHPLATLNLDGGMLRVGALDERGVLNERGGLLIVPEPDLASVAAGLALALLRRAQVRAGRTSISRACAR